MHDKYYEELEIKYNKLQKEHQELQDQYNSTSKDIASFFNKDLPQDKLIKRFNTIMKQSDKQSKHLLQDNEKQEELLINQSKLASMGEMIENIIHQMKQPLSLISTASSAMEIKKEMDMLDDKELLTFTKKITNATEYLSKTIDNFGSFFYNDKNKQKFPLATVIVKSKQLLESKFKGKQIKIIHELSDIIVLGIDNDMVQVITNMLSNSVDALETVDTQRLIFIKSNQIDNSIIIEIGDSAGGIDDSIIKRIFDSHFTTKDKNQGTGIGLHMSKMIIENSYNGTIKVENKDYTYNSGVFKGACFTIKIPVLQK